VRVLFVETDAFRRRVDALALHEGLRALQVELDERPDRGAIDAGTGGLRKVRMPDSTRGKGKRGGVRIHYLYLREHSVLYLVYLYTKNEQDALLPNQKRAFRRLAERIRNEWAREEHDG
jgi:hypothetical protein